MSLAELLEHDGLPGEVPVVIQLCVEFLKEHGLDVEGLFRIPGHQIDTEELAKIFYKADAALIGGISPNVDINTVAELLKKVLREMPEPLFTFHLHTQFIKAAGLENLEQRIDQTRNLFMQLHPLTRNTICYLFPFLITVCEHHEKNLMGKDNIATIFGASLMRSKEKDILESLSDKTDSVIMMFLEHFNEITSLHKQEIISLQYLPTENKGHSPVRFSKTAPSSPASKVVKEAPGSAKIVRRNLASDPLSKRRKSGDSNNIVRPQGKSLIERRAKRKKTAVANLANDGGKRTDSRTYPKFLPKDARRSLRLEKIPSPRATESKEIIVTSLRKPEKVAESPSKLAKPAFLEQSPKKLKTEKSSASSTESIEDEVPPITPNNPKVIEDNSSSKIERSLSRSASDTDLEATESFSEVKPINNEPVISTLQKPPRSLSHDNHKTLNGPVHNPFEKN
eukprot:TRINITY_DN518_c0_g1_i1.p1 TRINITY_DN518_c0_g1~~TRINITY_DN518_c0_g1_i1.p1  ORF type:complete len:453 (-),score=78.66 TRINITY_DN518_c0_g1_i1:52-1410(-)